MPRSILARLVTDLAFDDLAQRDILGNTFWVVTGTDDAGVANAADALTENDLDGRVAAIAPSG